MLNPEFKEKWIKALESGNFSQTTARLHDAVGYCCLGVACVVAGAEFKKSPDGSTWEIAFRGGEIISDEDATLTNDFRQEIGLSSEEQTRLYRMNDGHSIKGESGYLRKHSFQEIAAWIRENL